MSASEDFSVLGIVHYKTELLVTSINKSTGLTDLYVAGGMKWPGLTSRMYNLKYKAPQYSGFVCLTTDDDVKNMLRLCYVMKTSVVEIKSVLKDEYDDNRQRRNRNR